jgi:phosphoenolpyruvate carboxylase
VLSITDHKRLLDGDPVLQQSVRLRNGTIVPLGFLQVSLLKRLRECGNPAPLVLITLVTVRVSYSEGHY